MINVCSDIVIVDQNAKKTYPAGLKNIALTQFKMNITEIPHEKLANTAIPQTPMPPLLSSAKHDLAIVWKLFL